MKEIYRVKVRHSPWTHIACELPDHAIELLAVHRSGEAHRVVLARDILARLLWTGRSTLAADIPPAAGHSPVHFAWSELAQIGQRLSLPLWIDPAQAEVMTSGRFVGLEPAVSGMALSMTTECALELLTNRGRGDTITLTGPLSAIWKKGRSYLAQTPKRSWP